MSHRPTTTTGNKPAPKQIYNSRSKPPQGFSIIEPKLNEFKAKMREAEAENGEFTRKSEILWPIIRLTHMRSRYVYQMYLKKVITQAVFDYCSQMSLVDTALISYWKKPGFENLCCVGCAQHTSQFGSACICRVPANQLADKAPFECRGCGCRGCSGVKKAPAQPPVKDSDKGDDVKPTDGNAAGDKKDS